MRDKSIIIFILLVGFYISLQACDGDCVKCHPALLKSGKLDKNHKILGKCKSCHKLTIDDLSKMGAICGQDCWDCHSIKKTMTIKIQEHLVLSKCIACHKSLKNSSLTNSFPPSIDSVLFGNKEKSK